jgi:hypothetical protein
MFALFLLPYAVRNEPTAYEWVLYKAIHQFGDDLALIAPDSYWKDFEVRLARGDGVLSDAAETFFGYKIPTVAQIDRLKKITVPFDLLEGESRRFIGPNLAWKHITLEPVAPLEQALIEILGKLEPEAVVTWVNCRSAKQAARSLGIPLIHNEIGPLRAPNYRFTAYFDFEGVNGESSAHDRWRKFADEKAALPILSASQILSLFCSSPDPEIECTHDIGIALQCTDDSNLVAYSNGFTNHEAVATAAKWLPGSILARAHPGRPERVSGNVTWDDSPTPAHFLSKIRSLVTINSSMALEAMLRLKPTYILGESPFSEGGWDILSGGRDLSDDDWLTWLNWTIFGYLIPYERLFDSRYYRWRLGRPTEVEIYRDNFDYWSSTAL